MKITTDMIGSETASVRQTRLKSVYDWYKGDGAYVAAGNLGVVRAAFNDYLTSDIANKETFASWVVKFNLLNSPDTLIRTQLFGSGAKGVWFDPNDLPTLTQVSDGTVPVTAAGQPVGRMLDKSGNSAHATQAVAAKRPIYGVIPKGGRRNILPKTTQMHGGAPWVSIFSSLAANGDYPPIADPAQSVKVVPNSGSVGSAVKVNVNFAAGMHTISFYAKADGMSKVSFVTGSDGAFKSTVFDLASVTTSGTPAGWTVSIVSVGGGWFRCITSLVSVAGAHSVSFTNTGTGITGDGTIGYLIAAPQLETGSVVTPYQRVMSAYEIYESGVPSLPYLAYDLNDDELPATIPSLGSNATVWFATDMGSRILSGQTFAAGPISTLRGARTYAMGAIDRPLTAGETAALTTYLDRVMLGSAPPANDRIAAIWGSSSADLMANDFASAMALVGVASYDGGQSGEWADQIFARMGSRPVALSFPSNTIPASGAALVTATNWNSGSNQLLTYSGTIAGVHGALAWSPGNSSLVFTRTTPGDAVAVGGPTVMIPQDGPQYRTGIALLWAGKNNITGGDSLARVIQLTDEAVAYLTPSAPHVLVLGHFVNSGANGAQKTNVATVNTTHAQTYGAAFVDVQAWLMSSQVWIDTGITPTGADTAAQAAGELPLSLGRDSQHLSETTELALMRKVILPRIKSLWGIGLPVDDAVMWYEASNPDTTLRRDNLVTGVDFGTYGAKSSQVGYDQYFSDGAVETPTQSSAMETPSFTAFWAMRVYTGDTYHGSGQRIITTFTGASGSSIRADQNSVDMFVNNFETNRSMTHSLGFDTWGLFVTRLNSADNSLTIRCLTTDQTYDDVITGDRTLNTTFGWRIGSNPETGRLDLGHMSVFGRALDDTEITTMADEIRRRLSLVGVAV